MRAGLGGSGILEHTEAGGVQPRQCCMVYIGNEVT